jgi:hypothetical protein
MCKAVASQPGLLHHERQQVNCEACQDALCNNFLRFGRVEWRRLAFPN